METVLSGMRATGKLHLGNYFGAARNYVRMQQSGEYNCFFFIADYHSLTTHTMPAELKANTRQVLIDYLACGLNPEVSPIYIQSDVPEIPELYLILNMFAYKGELEKTASFKEKARKKGQTLNAGLLTYPSLMAADILIHRADKVPVGKDQEQHLEMTRNFAKRFNHYYETDFLPEPQAFNFGEELVKIPGLDGSTKMSKSDDEKNAIFLSDDPDTILKKVKRAKTDSGPSEKNSEKPQEIENLFAIMKSVSSEETLQSFEEDYNNCNIRYGDMKKKIAEDVIDFLAPMRERILELEQNPTYLHEVIKYGAEKARESARETLEGVRDIIGVGSL
jgi:tryptophanyl-tRNA synthetase